MLALTFTLSFLGILDVLGDVGDVGTVIVVVLCIPVGLFVQYLVNIGCLVLMPLRSWGTGLALWPWSGIWVA